MIRTILSYCVLAGAIVAVPLFGMVLLMADQPPPAWGMAIGYALMLIAFSTVFIAIKRRRDVEGGGVIRFWPALGLGLGISLVASLFYVIAWEAALAVSGADFIAQYARSTIEAERAAGASAAELARLSAEMAKLQQDYRDPLFRVPLTLLEILPVGVLASLVSAGLLRNPRFLPAASA